MKMSLHCYLNFIASGRSANVNSKRDRKKADWSDWRRETAHIEDGYLVRAQIIYGNKNAKILHDAIKWKQVSKRVVIGNLSALVL